VSNTPSQSRNSGGHCNATSDAANTSKTPCWPSPDWSPTAAPNGKDHPVGPSAQDVRTPIVHNLVSLTSAAFGDIGHIGTSGLSVAMIECTDIKHERTSCALSSSTAAQIHVVGVLTDRRGQVQRPDVRHAKDSTGHHAPWSLAAWRRYPRRRTFAWAGLTDTSTPLTSRFRFVQGLVGCATGCRSRTGQRTPGRRPVPC
jgi:hypothetical protein